MKYPGPLSKPYILLGPLLGLLLLTACASNTTSVPAIDDFEYSAINAMDRGYEKQAQDALLAAMRRYQASDNLSGQWRTHYLLARLYLGQGEKGAANPHIDALEALAASIDDPNIAFSTYLLLGQQRDPAYFEHARAIGKSPLQSALVLTYMKQYEAAVMKLEPEDVDQPADRAFIYYRYGVHGASADALLRALSLYKRAGDARGIADSLMQLAALSRQSGDSMAANNYAGRAQRVLAASGDELRAAAVQRWLEAPF